MLRAIFTMGTCVVCGAVLGASILLVLRLDALAARTPWELPASTWRASFPDAQPEELAVLLGTVVGTAGGAAVGAYWLLRVRTERPGRKHRALHHPLGLVSAAGLTIVVASPCLYAVHDRLVAEANDAFSPWCREDTEAEDAQMLIARALPLLDGPSASRWRRRDPRRDAALESWGYKRTLVQRLLPLVVRALSSQSHAVRERALWFLEDIGREAGSAEGGLRECLKGAQTPADRMSTAMALYSVTGDYSELLSSSREVLLQDPEARNRRMAAYNIGSLERQATDLAPLLQVATENDPSPEVRTACREALGWIYADR